VNDPTTVALFRCYVYAASERKAYSPCALIYLLS